jgi:hypothetical protein
MYSNSDFERFFLRYKSEALTNKESIQSFCFKQDPLQPFREMVQRYIPQIGSYTSDRSTGFWLIVNGCRDYENLLPITIGLGNNKLKKSTPF